MTLPRFAAAGGTLEPMVDKLLGYLGDPELHDGTVVAVRHENDVGCVLVRALSGRFIEVVFSEVESLTQHRAVGMTLYALAEMAVVEVEWPRRFVFVNWDEEADALVRVAR